MRTTATSRSELRSEMRRRRRRTALHERAGCARRVAAHLATADLVRRSRRIACYRAVEGELDLSPLLPRLWAMGKRAYLPVLHGAKLWFLPYEANTPLAANRYGIPEPDVAPRLRCAPRALDLVLAPLVGFDEEGNRLGMGGGYYDRTFAYMRHSRAWMRPVLIGVAYEFQAVAELPADRWDVPLAGVVTEKGWRFFRSSSALFA